MSRIKRCAILIVVLALAACGGGGSKAAAPTTAPPTTVAALGNIHISLDLVGGQGSHLVFENDSPDAPCGLQSGSKFAIASTGQLTVTDENHTTVGIASLNAGKLDAATLITRPGGALVAFRCLFEVTVNITSAPKSLSCHFAWDNAAPIDIDKEASAVTGGVLTLTKAL
jgi:hypothetical protein